MPNRNQRGGAAPRPDAKFAPRISPANLADLRLKAARNRGTLDALFKQIWSRAEAEEEDEDKLPRPLISKAFEQLRPLILNESISHRDYHRATHSARIILADMDKTTRDTARYILLEAVAALHGSKDFSEIPTKRLVRMAALVGEAYALANLDSPSAAQTGDRFEQERDGYPPLFDSRPTVSGKSPTAMQWFDQHWKSRVEAGTTGDDIRKADLKFYNAFASALRRDGRKLSDILPPSPTRGRKGVTPPDREERQRALSRERVRRWRAGRDPA